MQVRQAFASRKQLKKENWMQYLDALEGLRSQGFLNKPTTTKRYEYVQRFIESVRDAAFWRELSIIYATETTALTVDTRATLLVIVPPATSIAIAWGRVYRGELLRGPLLCRLWLGRPCSIPMHGNSSERWLRLQPMRRSGSSWRRRPYGTIGRWSCTDAPPSRPTCLLYPFNHHVWC